MALSFLLVLTVQSCAVTFHFFTSPRTPFDLESMLSKVALDLSSRVQFTVQNVLSSTDTWEITAEEVGFDYTYDQELTSMLREQDADLIIMWNETNFEVYGDMFSQYVQALKFTRMTVISDSKPSNVRLSQILTQTLPSVYEELHYIPYDADEDFCLQFVGEVIKPSGVNLFAIITDEAAAKNLLLAFAEKKLNKEGYAYVLTDRASYSQHLIQNSTGTLYVAEARSAQAESLEEAEEQRLKPILERLLSGQTDSDVIKAYSPTFVLVNLVNSVPRIVATRPEEVGVNITFPGNTFTPPVRCTAVIQTSVNYQFIDLSGNLIPSFAVVMRGVQVAFQETNNRTEAIIPNFMVNDYSVCFNGEVFNYTFTKLQIAHNLLHIGVIHFPPPLATNIIGTFQVLKDLNITKPMTIGSGSSVLSSPKDYPMYIRARTSNAYTALVMARIFGNFRWKRAAILYAMDQGDNQDFYNAFMNLTSTFGINITNNSTMRGLPPLLITMPGDMLNATLSDIINSTVRILIILHSNVYGIAEAMFDLGVRSEYLICTWYGMSYTFFNGNEASFHKRRVVLKGALQFYPTPFIGPKGAQVLAYLEAWDGVNYFPNTCYYYDCAMLYLYSTGYMIARGIDYEDPDQIIEAMRGTRFTGCTGVINIAPGSNDRAAAQFSVLNVRYYEINDTVQMNDVMYYNPFSSTLYQQIRPIMWPDNSTTVFTDTFISDFGCLFQEKQIRDFPHGQNLGFGICFGVCILTGMSCFFLWKRCWNCWHSMMQSTYEISADDVMQLIAVPVELLQFSALGPDSGHLSYTLSALCASTVFDLEDFIDYSDGGYWKVVRAVLGCVGIYVLLCIIKFTGFEKRLECLPLVSFLMLWMDLCLPTFSSLIVIPAVSVLFSTFLCYKSIGDDFRASYHIYDCQQFCWQGAHITYVSLCSISLAVFIPLNIFTKPLWQELQPNLHIRAQPPALVVKSLVQVMLIALSQTLKEEYSSLHAGLYFAVFGCYLVFIIWFKQYNYDR